MSKSIIGRQYFTTSRGVAVVAIAVAILVCMGAIAVWHVTSNERQKTMLEWQKQLAAVAENSAAVADKWVEKQFTVLSNLSSNLSLQLYLTEFVQSQTGISGVTDASVQTTYLRMLLQVTAERSGFEPQGFSANATSSNVQALGVGGIAIIDKNGGMVVSSRGMPPLHGILEDFVKSSPLGQRNFLDIFRSADGNPMLAFLTPVYAVQGNNSPADQIGYLIGVRPVGKDMIDEIYPSMLPYESAETLLLRKQENMLEYISPTSDAKEMLSLRLDIDTPELAEAKAFNHPGEFVSGFDHARNQVLATARTLSNAPWVVVHKVDESEAMNSTRLRVQQLSILLIAGATSAVLIMLAVWRHASSLRAEGVADAYRAVSDRNRRLHELLHLIADNEPDAMFLIDGEGVVRYLNARFAALTGMTVEEIRKRRLQAILPVEESERHLAIAQRVLESNIAETAIFHRLQGGQMRVLQATYLPLTKIPDPDSHQNVEGVLVTEQDITSAVIERDKRERTLRKIIMTLLAIVDSRDAFAANHSARVAKLAGLIADEMRVDGVVHDTAVAAGQLMNVGKIFVPEATLTHAGALKNEERQKIRECIMKAADLMEGIEFDGPVAETIRQSQERWDGTGVLGLKETNILLPARIVCVSNAFVSMVSNRSYREGMKLDEAISHLLDQIGHHYDRAAVVALANYLENSGEDNSWLKDGIISEPPLVVDNDKARANNRPRRKKN